MEHIMQSDATTKAIAETQPWFTYGRYSSDHLEMRAVAPQGQGNVLAAAPEGGCVHLYVPGGQVATKVQVGPFRKSPFQDTYYPEWARYLP